MTARLPVYILLDTSGSMSGTRIQRVLELCSNFCTQLCQETGTKDTVWLSVITYSETSTTQIPLSPIHEIQLPISYSTNGLSNTWSALNYLEKQASEEISFRSSLDEQGDFKPLLLFFTDGLSTDVQPTDETWREIDWSQTIFFSIGPDADPIYNSLFSKNISLEEYHGSMIEFLCWIQQGLSHSI